MKQMKQKAEKHLVKKESKKQRILPPKICNDAWCLILGYCNLGTLVHVSNVNRECRKIVFENQNHKVWKPNDLEELSIHKNNDLVLCIVKNNWIPSVLENKWWLHSTLNPNIALFEYLCGIGHFKAVGFLLKYKGIDIGSDNSYFLMLAIHSKNFKLVRLLLQDERVDPSVDDNRAFKFACGNRDLRIIKLLVQDPRVDPGAGNNEAIRCACENGDLKTVRFLLRYPNVDPSANNNAAITEAIIFDHIQVVKLLKRDPRVKKVGLDDYYKPLLDNCLKGL